MNDNKKIFITATDTGVGKTVLSLLVMKYFYAKGKNPFYVKPFQTGCRDAHDMDSDAAFIYSHVKQLRGSDPSQSVPFCFKNPKAPFFAARNENNPIVPAHVESVVTFIEKKCASHSPVIIEGAGGLCVPITENFLMIDLIEKTEASVIIAARANLGTINHTLMSTSMLFNRKIKPIGILFINPDKQPYDQKAIDENSEAIRLFSGLAVSGIINHIEDFSKNGKEYFSLFDSIFHV